MEFNSWAFCLGFLAFYPLYRATAKRLQLQNILVLGASYVFYAWWDWRYLSLLLFSTTVDFAVSHAMQEASARGRRWLLTASVVTHMTLLCVFKYLNFFLVSTQDALSALGLHWSLPALNILLPLGISFYTFQSLGYCIDVYRREQRPVARLTDFALYVAFFPQLVAGPIERAAQLIPQILSPRHPQSAQVSAGLFLLAWGYTKKLAIADNAGAAADYVFLYYESLYGADLVLGVLAFGVQIYADFSAYSDIARGLGKVLGFELSLNFRTPYLARSPREFWRRWHITLSTWLRDYLYIPLGGNRGTAFSTCRNIMLTMVLGGLWHGARWNFLLWGGYHGALLVVQHLVPARWGRAAPSWLGVVGTLVLVNFGWLLFRCETPDQFFHFITHAGFAPSAETGLLLGQLTTAAAPLVLMTAWQVTARNLIPVAGWSALHQAPALVLMLLFLLLFGARSSSEFIYFQF